MKVLTLKTSGQAVVEFILTLGLAVVVVGAITQFMRQNSGLMWKRLVCEISAPCPGCEAADAAKNVAGKLGKGIGLGGAECK